MSAMPEMINATATISDSQVFSNTAYRGGGLYLSYNAPALNGNVIAFNTASASGDYGGLPQRIAQPKKTESATHDESGASFADAPL